jgi:hypothetical protein
MIFGIMILYKHIRRAGNISLFPLPPHPGPASSVFQAGSLS